jgi:hypothetical protein
MPALPDRPFWHISTAGIFFQGGAAAIDTSTIIAALVHGLTGGSAFAVGTAAAISRFGWLFPQLFVAFYAQQRTSRLPFYMAGAFGRVACLVALAALVWGSAPSAGPTVALFFAIWTVYAFVSAAVFRRRSARAGRRRTGPTLARGAAVCRRLEGDSRARGRAAIPAETCRARGRPFRAGALPG